MLSTDGPEIKRAARYPVFFLAHTSRVSPQTLKNELGYHQKNKKGPPPENAGSASPLEMRYRGRA